MGGRTCGEGAAAGQGLGLAFRPPQGLWVCALSPAPLKAFLALDLAQFLQQDGPATPPHPRAPCPPGLHLSNAPSLGVPARWVEELCARWRLALALPLLKDPLWGPLTFQQDRSCPPDRTTSSKARLGPGREEEWACGLVPLFSTATGTCHHNSNMSNLEAGVLNSRGHRAGSYGGSREELSPCLL